jgi:hypothetical protein
MLQKCSSCAQNSRARTRASIPDIKLALDNFLLEPPGDDEQPARVHPEDDLSDIVAQIRARFAQPT